MGIHSWFIQSELNPEEAFVIAVVDTIGLGNRVIAEIRSAATQSTGLPPSRILVAATHSHAGCDLQGLWGGVTDSYRGFVVKAAAESMAEAVRSAEPVTLYASSLTPGEGLTNNRRGWGFSLNTTTVLQAKSRRDPNRIVGNLVNFAAHPTTLSANNFLMSADYPFWVRKFVSEKTSARTVFVNGPIGDVTPRTEGSDFERPEFYGAKIADVVAESLRNQIVVEEGMEFRTANWFHEVTNPIFQIAFSIGLLDKYYHTRTREGKLGIDTEVKVFHLGGQVSGVTFPGEALTRTALPVRGFMERKTRFQLTFGLTQDTLGYLVPSDEWFSGRNGNYEELVSVDKLMGDTVRDQLLQILQQTGSSPGDGVETVSELLKPREDGDLPSSLFRAQLPEDLREFAMVLRFQSQGNVEEALEYLAEHNSEYAELAEFLLRLRAHTHAG